jgi:hypothetical protein
MPADHGGAGVKSGLRQGLVAAENANSLSKNLPLELRLPFAGALATSAPNFPTSHPAFCPGFTRVLRAQ